MKIDVAKLTKITDDIDAKRTELAFARITTADAAAKEAALSGQLDQLSNQLEKVLEPFRAFLKR